MTTVEEVTLKLRMVASGLVLIAWYVVKAVYNC